MYRHEIILYNYWDSINKITIEKLTKIYSCYYHQQIVEFEKKRSIIEFHY
jgi:hypothetical protein